MGNAAQESHGGLALERVVFFTDAVFAIAITLLVLEIRLPELEDVTNAALTRALLDLRPVMLGFLLSFAVIAMLWLAHWRRFQSLVAVDDTLVRLNLGLLACVALVPFPTAVIGEYGDQPAAVVLYASIMALAGLFGTASWWHASRAGLTTRQHGRRWVRLNTLRGLSVPAVFLGSLPLVLVHPYVAEVSWVLLAPIQGWVTREQRKAA